MMEITYAYTKKRKEFGKQAIFSESPTELLDTIDSNICEQKKYGLRNPVNREVQNTTPQSEHFINSVRNESIVHGTNHLEGGWPKEVNMLDEEATGRYRRRIERDDGYVDAILNTYPKFTHYIKQNNAIEMYQMYYQGMKPQLPVEKSEVFKKNVFREPMRPVASIAWTIEEDSKLVVAYCNRTYPVVGTVNNIMTCNVWNMEDPNTPAHILEPPSACWKVTCSPVRPNIILGGLADGRVCIFDIRASTEPVSFCAMHLAHRYPVNSLIYLHSRLNNEFFSGSTDGNCIWWDIRNLAVHTDSLTISLDIPLGDTPNLSNAEGVSTLQYDRTLPTRFLCGTDTGLVVNVNRKGKTQSEIISSVFRAQNGPVKAVHRSPLSTKMFITCGDWTVNIWSDDVLTSPIISGTPHRYQITDVAWAPNRISGYMCVSADGKLRYWDLLRKYREPVVTAVVSKHSLLKLAVHEEGRLVAVGDEAGSTYLLNLSDNLVFSGDKDKQMMLQSYDRETRREHILETRVKEIRLKLRAEEEAAATIPIVEVFDEEAQIKTTEDDYKTIVAEEIYRAGITSTSDSITPTPKRIEKMRKR